jgi:bifunctional protein folD
MILLKTYGIPLKGKNVTVIGQSNIVGKPTCLELLMQEATISICNRETRFLSDYTKKADIIIAAAGSPGLIGADAVQEGVVVIDVGINRLPDGQIVGDVDFCQVKEKASYITPVPGGVGPMTIASLMDNTLIAAQALS